MEYKATASATAGVAKTIHREEYTRLLALLRQTREAAGLRQVDVATRLGVAQSYVSKVESGERRLDILELRDYCAVLDVTLSEFLRAFEFDA